MKKAIVFSAVFLLVFACGARAATLIDSAEYLVTTVESITFEWDDPSNVADTFNVRLYNVERNSYTDLGSTTQKTKTFKLPRSGHFVPEVRSCKGATCTVWSRSTELTFSPSINGQVRAWRLYGYPAPPGQPTITR